MQKPGLRARVLPRPDVGVRNAALYLRVSTGRQAEQDLSTMPVPLVQAGAAA